MLKNFKTYQMAKNLYRNCEKIRAKYYIKNQLDRASLSIVLNLAEGSGKATKKDKAKFYTIALGSLREVYAILDILEKGELLKECELIGAHIWNLVKNPGP